MTDSNCAIWLYGSRARGNSDQRSDTDVLVVSDHLLPSIERLRDCGVREPDSASYYTWNELSSMAAYGSLFLQHLRLEGCPLHEDPTCSARMASILSHMPQYKLAARDIRGFRAVLGDVVEASQCKNTIVYELSVLGTVIRHCAILGCWFLNTPTFGRIEPVASLVGACELPSVISAEFPDLYDYRLYVDGRITLPRRNMPDCSEWSARASKVILSVESICERTA